MPDDRWVVNTIGLTKIFKDFWKRDKVTAVKDLDLKIRQGEIFGLLGPNGSGKSTTIKMLLGLLRPTRGRVSIFGKPPTDVATKNRIGYLPEESYLYRFLDARETLSLYSKLFMQAREIRLNRIDKLLEMVGLQHQSKRRIGEYSKGMARRIGLAQALINDPDFLILDEPTTGMDPIGTKQIKELIRELGKRGKTILLSSHLLADVQDVCDRVCILYGGQERALGTLCELLSKTDTTQLTTPRLREETLAEIRRVIQQHENIDQLEVTHPVEKLEQYFIRIVEDARAASVATYGVETSGAMPDFLSEPEGDQVLETLVAAAKQPTMPAHESIEPAMPPASLSEEVLSDLIQDAESASSQPSEPASSPQTTNEVTPGEPTHPHTNENIVDTQVIDDLLQQKEGDHRG